jgi:hypothetical protein
MDTKAMVRPAITVGVVLVLQKFKPLQLIPLGFVKSNEGLIELVIGLAGTIGFGLKEAKTSWAQGIFEGFLVSGALKTINKYVMKA